MTNYEKRFWSKVKKTDNCWLWMGTTSLNRSRAGQLCGKFFASVGKLRFWKAANYSWYLHNGVNLGGLHVLHTCDNALCVNPDHLFLGTHQDNMDDKVAKGRQARGEGHGRARLTEDDIRAMRSSGLSESRVAKKWRISPSHAHRIMTRERWAHVD
jgi:hypothetical protein